MPPLGRLQDAAELLFLERPAGAERNAGQRVVGDRDGKAGFIAQHFVEALQQRPAAGQHDALVANIGGEFGRSILECDADALDDGPDRLGQRFGDLALVDRDFLGNAVHQVATLDVNGLADAVDGRLGDADFLLDPLGRGFADQEVVVAPDVRADGFIHLVAADAYGGGVGGAAQAQHGDLGRAAADVDDHRSDRGGHRHVGADRGSHGLLDQIDGAGPGVGGGGADRAALDRSRSGRDTDHDFREAPGAHLAAVHLVDEMLDHLLGDVDVGNDSIAQGADGFDLVGRLAHHQLGVLANGLDLLDAVD